MNIKDFLLDNYIWILVIILISIVTIIGFLADKKKNGKKDKAEPSNGNPPQGPAPVPQNPVQYQQPMNNNQAPLTPNAPLNFAMNNTTVGPVGNNQGQPQPNNQGGVPYEANNQNLYNQPTNQTRPVAPQPEPPMNNPNLMNQQVEQQPATPLQTLGNFEQPNPVIKEANMNVLPPIGAPQPVENIGGGNMNQESIYQPLSEQVPIVPATNISVNPYQESANNNVSNEFMNNNYQNVAQPMPSNNYQQPMMPKPEQPMINNPEPIPNNNFNTIPQPMTPPQPMNPQQVNFVYGTPNNNNQSPQ